MLLFPFLVYSFFMKGNRLTTSFIISFFTSLPVSSPFPDRPRANNLTEHGFGVENDDSTYGLKWLEAASGQNG